MTVGDASPEEAAQARSSDRSAPGTDRWPSAAARQAQPFPATGIGRLVPACRGRRGAGPSRRGLREQLIGWGFALPFVIVFTLFLAGPILASLVMSFTDFGLRDLRNPLGTDFVGLHNYQELLGDPKFHKAMINTAYFVIVGVPVTLLLGLGAALALDRGIRRFRTVFRVGYYLPVVTSIVAIAVVWRFCSIPIRA